MSTSPEITAIINDLMDKTRKRYHLMRAHQRLDLQIQSYERGFRTQAKEIIGLTDKQEIEDYVDRKAIDLKIPLHAALMAIEGPRKAYEKQIKALGLLLPVYPWTEKIRGISPFGLGLLIGEIKDLSDYSLPGKVWKRMSLDVDEDGRAQRKVAGISEEEARRRGFCPRRRQLAFVLADGMIKRNKNPDGSDGEYRVLYVERKQYEYDREPNMPPFIAHYRAGRFMFKRFLLELWREWRAVAKV